MSKNILYILSDVLTAAANQLIIAAVETDDTETAAVENAPQEATEAPQEATEAPQEAAPAVLDAATEAEAAAAAEIISEVENVTKNKPNDFDERLKKAMEILKGRA